MTLPSGRHSEKLLAAEDFATALSDSVAVHVRVGEMLAAAGHRLLTAHEGGWAPPLDGNCEAVAWVAAAIVDTGCGGDRARHRRESLFDPATGDYVLAAEGRRLQASALIDDWLDLTAAFPLRSIEDGLAEDDWIEWAALTERATGVQLIGDDLFATDLERLRRGINEQVATAILVKPNQAGTLSEALEVIELARANGYRTIVSARSGETEDAFLADLAVETAAGQIKVGSVTRSERLTNWNQLLRLEEELGADAYVRASGAVGREPGFVDTPGEHLMKNRMRRAHRMTKENDGTMLDKVNLRGITWNHPRGLDPLLAASDVYAELVPEVRVEWTTRSLSGFGEDPLIDLAASYDLLIIDHPFVGDAAASTAFHSLDALAEPDDLLERERASVGPSHASYQYAGHQWALAIDAAAQVSAVHERIKDPMPRTWDDVFELGARLRRDGSWMTVPMWPADLCVATFTIGKGMGLDLFVDGRVFPRGRGEPVLAVLKRLCDLSHPDAPTWNPPTVLDQMRDGVVRYCPILFGYSNYSRPSAPGERVSFGDIPTQSGTATGSTLGGAGIAISTRCAHPKEAMAYATWVTSAEVQTGVYFRSGGQPGRRESWLDVSVNRASGEFFRRTLSTMDGAWVRPRIRGYQAFQNAASTIVVDYVTGGTSATTTLDDLDALWQSIERAAAS